MLVKYTDEQENSYYYAKENSSRFEYSSFSKIVLPLKQKAYVKQYLPEPVIECTIKGQSKQMLLHEAINIVLRLRKQALSTTVSNAYIKQTSDTLCDYYDYLESTTGDYVSCTSKQDNNMLNEVMADLSKLNDYDEIKHDAKITFKCQ